MKNFIKITFGILALLFLVSMTQTSTKKYKCMIQMANYEGEGAYVIVSLINPDGNYEKTLYVHGEDDEWYHEISSWWKFYGRKRTNLDGITGSTIAGGERGYNVLKIDPAKINKGYTLRFESAVEAKNYFEKDLEFELTTANLQKKMTGSGFIRYIRMVAQ